MIKQIKQLFETKISSITPTIETAYEGVVFTSTNGTPYQELYIIPAINEAPYINETLHYEKGIFQITLKYPTGTGTGATLDRVSLYMDNFFSGMSLTKDDVKVSVINAPKIVNLGANGDRLVYVISINYKAHKI